MAPLNPQNDQYLDNPSASPDVLASGKATQAVMQSLQKPVTTPDNSGYTQSVPVSSYGTPASENLSNFYKNPAFTQMQPTNTPLAEESTSTTQPMPIGYRWPSPKIDPVTGQPSSAPASPDTKIANLPSFMGGGQMSVDPTQTDKIVGSYGNDIGITSAEAAQLRGGRSAADIKVDYIVPISDGGTNTYANKAAFSTQDYIQKKKVEAVSNTLFEMGQITKDQKILMDTSWKDHD